MKLLLFIFFLLIPVCFAQSQSKTSKADSLEARQLSETTQLLKQKELQRLLDSLRKQEVLQEIKQLKSGDSRRKTELERRYREMVRQDSVRHVQKMQEIARLKASAKGFPVAPFGDTLFFIYTRIGAFNEQERAKAISARIEKLNKSNYFSSDSLSIVDSDAESDILYGGKIILSITDTDALWFGQDRRQLAAEYLKKIQAAIKQEREKNSFKNLLIHIGLTILVLVGLFLIVYLINKLFGWLKLFVYSKRHTHFNGIRIRNYQLFDRQKQLNFIIMVINSLRIIILLLSLYLALPILFSIFPQTHGWADTLISWVVSPAMQIIRSTLDYLPNLFTIGVVFLFTRYSVKVLAFFAREIEQEHLKITGFYKDWAMPTFNIVRFLLYVFMFIVIFPYLPGSKSPIFQGVSVFLGILFSLGSSSAISNIVAGMVITYMRPFRIGDRVKIGEITGDVIEKSMLVTRIRTIKNEDITVPNSSVLSGHTINFTTSSQELGLILNTGVTIGYDVPWKQVHALLIAAARATDGVAQDKEPFVFQTSLDDFYVSYQLNAYTRQSHRMAAIYSELHRHILDKFNEAGVEIMSPHYRACRDGSQVTIPAIDAVLKDSH